MEIPEWLKTVESNKAAVAGQALPLLKKPKERFPDKTLRHVIAFTEDTLFNEMTSAKKGLLQKIEPRLKVLTVMFFIVLLSIQNNLYAISAFILISLALAFISKIPLFLFIQRVLPAFIFTLLISMMATLNLVVKGEPMIRLFILKSRWSIGALDIPQEIFITKQGLLSAATLLLRATASVSLVFLLTLTTPPNRFIKAVSSFMPGAFKSIVSISYRYIFFLLRKVEQFIMGFKSRNISSVYNGVTGRKWVASRMSLLFSISLNLSKEIEQAMESRGYNYKLKVESEKLKVSELSRTDVLWIIFSLILSGVMIWKSLT